MEKNEPELVYCELHHGYVESWEAYYVSNIHQCRFIPAKGTEIPNDHYGVCHDCLVEELHPLKAYNYEEYF